MSNKTCSIRPLLPSPEKLRQDLARGVQQAAREHSSFANHRTVQIPDKFTIPKIEICEGRPRRRV
jgi:hypothetical protein